MMYCKNVIKITEMLTFPKAFFNILYIFSALHVPLSLLLLT